jgi:membrane-bound lytic murein transglycosylase A
VCRCRNALAALLGLGLAACVSIRPAPGIGAALPWSELPGWSDTSLVAAWPALLQSCSKLASRDTQWRAICDDAALFPNPNEDIVRAFFETRFTPHTQHNAEGATDGLITGYYEPLLNGSRTRSERYRYPIYRVPDDLVTIDLGDLYPELRNQRLRGRLQGKRVVPYFDRSQIERDRSPLAGNELLWVDDLVALFFLQIQGSGRVRLPNGEMVHVGYADQNGHPYRAIGRTLIERTGLKPEEVDAPAIRAWLAANPKEVQTILNSNPSYVFFSVRDAALPGPLGALGVPLLAEHAIAVDPAYIPLGVPVWLDTSLPSARSSPAASRAAPASANAAKDRPPPAGVSGSRTPEASERQAGTSPAGGTARVSGDSPYRRLVFAQDTGGAIRGPVRADVFFGYGPLAEERAGRMRQSGRLYVLLPAPRS